MLPNSYSCQKCPDAAKAEVRINENESTCNTASLKLLTPSGLDANRTELSTQQTLMQNSDTLVVPKNNPQTQSSSHLNSAQLAGTELNKGSKEPKLALSASQNQSSARLSHPKLSLSKHSPAFSSESIDDRSIQSRFTVSPIARTVMALLISLHGFYQTPGIGTKNPSLSDFDISSHVIQIHKSGLNLSDKPSSTVDSSDRPVYSI